MTLLDRRYNETSYNRPPRSLITKIIDGINFAFYESLTVCSTAFLIHWLSSFRGGFGVEANLKGVRNAKHRINTHALSMVLSFVLFLPQVRAVRIGLRLSPGLFYCHEAICNILAILCFIIGMVEILAITEESISDPRNSPDLGIHCFISVIASLILLVCVLCFIAKGIRQTNDKNHPLVIRLTQNVLEHTLDLFGFLSILTGYLSYAIYINSAKDIGMGDIFTEEFDLTSNERSIHLASIGLIGTFYLVGTLYLGKLHNMEFHNETVTFSMYKLHYEDLISAFEHYQEGDIVDLTHLKT